MAFWWLLAEGVLVVIAHWAWRYASLGSSPGFQWKANSLVALIVILGSSLLVARHVHPWFAHAIPEVMVFRKWVVWNGLCTVWVGFEAALVLYLSRLIDVLEGRSKRRGMSLLVFALLTFFAVFHFSVGDLVNHGAFARTELLNVLKFYVRVCGVLWVVIEFAGAYKIFVVHRLVLARMR